MSHPSCQITPSSPQTRTVPWSLMDSIINSTSLFWGGRTETSSQFHSQTPSFQPPNPPMLMLGFPQKSEELHQLIHDEEGGPQTSEQETPPSTGRGVDLVDTKARQTPGSRSRNSLRSLINIYIYMPMVVFERKKL